jgi:hypothetical protein
MGATTMLHGKDQSNRNPWTSAALAGAFVRLGLAACTSTILLVLGGCPTTVTQRLDAKFDADPLGDPPTLPAPTPPKDTLVWRTDFFFSASVVPDPAGGRLVRVAPLPAFTSAPDDRRVFLIAVTEPFTTSPVPNLRGHVRLRLINPPGIVGFGLRPLQVEQTLDVIGGVEVGTYLPPAGGDVYVLQSFKGSRLSDPYGLPSDGIISGYASGSVIDINWSIDQAARIFYANATGEVASSSTQSISFPDFFDGNATTPIQRLEIHFWMQKPTTDTVLFIDNLLAEEYK